MKKCNESLEEPSLLDNLAGQYTQLVEIPAWKDFMGRVEGLREQFKEAVLRGERDRLGDDLTPQFRAMYGCLTQVITLPEQIMLENKKTKEEILGVPIVE